MSISKKVLIYPYSRSMRAFIVYRQLLKKDMEIKGIVSPKGWGLSGDIINSFGKQFVVKDNFEEELVRCDYVWFCEDGEHELPEKVLKEKLLKTIQSGRKIIYTRKERFSDINLTPYIIREPQLNKRVDPLFMNELLEVDIPVITIMGNARNVDQAEVQLALQYEFTQRDYKVLSLLSMQSAPLVNSYRMPDVLSNGEITSNDKILFFNHYLRALEEIEKPDILIVGTSGGIYPYEQSVYREFGKGLFEIMCAIKTDFSILCSIYGEGIQEELCIEKEILENRYQFAVDAVHIAPYYWNNKESVGSARKAETIELDEEFLYNNITNLDESGIWNLRKYQNVQKLVDEIIDELS